MTLSQQHRIMTTAVETVRRVINLRLKVLVEFLRRLHRKSPPDLRHFDLAVREIIAARMWRAMTGKLSGRGAPHGYGKAIGGHAGASCLHQIHFER